MTRFLRLLPVAAIVALFGLAPTVGAAALPPGGQLARIARVVDGDTVNLTSGARVRLVQIDTPEVYYSAECYGEQASAVTKRLLPPGTLVRLYREPKTDAVDQYGRLLRYVFRVRGRAERERPIGQGRRRGAVLLRLPAWPLLQPPRPARPSGASAPLGLVGPLPGHAVRPEPRSIDGTTLGRVYRSHHAGRFANRARDRRRDRKAAGNLSATRERARDRAGLPEAARQAGPFRGLALEQRRALGSRHGATSRRGPLRLTAEQPLDTVAPTRWEPAPRAGASARRRC